MAQESQGYGAGQAFCANCGARTEPGAAFCGSCGTATNSGQGPGWQGAPYVPVRLTIDYEFAEPLPEGARITNRLLLSSSGYLSFPSTSPWSSTALQPLS